VIALIQRVLQAEVLVDNTSIARIDKGILLFLGVEKNDNQQNALNLLTKVLNFRIFEDDNHKMNLSLLDCHKDLLVVPQFTLAADTEKGNRPGFGRAAPPEDAQQLFNVFTEMAEQRIKKVETGQFGADMQVSLINDGPITFWLQK